MNLRWLNPDSISVMLVLMSVAALAHILFFPVHSKPDSSSAPSSAPSGAPSSAPSSAAPNAKSISRLFASPNRHPSIDTASNAGPSWISKFYGVKLKGTVSDRIAVVEDLSSGRERILKLNETINSGTIREIGRSRLRIEGPAGTETLELPADASSLPPAPLAPETSKTPISRAELAKILTDVDSLATEINLQPVRDAVGNPFGYKITFLKPQGLLARTGLRKNDVITSVNGQRIRSMEEVYRVLEEASHQTKMSINLRRNEADVPIEIALH